MNLRHTWIGIHYRLFSGSDALNRLLEKIAVQVEYGRRVKDVVEDLALRAQRRGLTGSAEKTMLDGCRRVFARGGSIADGLAPGLSPVAYALISNGAISGSLPEALNLAARLNRMSASMTKEALSGVVEPLLSIFILYYFVRFLFQQVTTSFGSMVKGHLTGVATVTMEMGRFAQSNGVWFVLCALIALVIVIFWSLPRWRGRLRTFFDKTLPPYTVYRQIQGATWLLSYAALLESGMTVKQVLRQTRQTASPWLDERLEAVLVGLGRGYNIGEALRLAGYGFPSADIIDDLEVFSNFPNLQDKLMSLAERSLTDTRKRVSLTNKVISEVSKAMIAVVFAVMFFGLMGIITAVAGSAGV